MDELLLGEPDCQEAGKVEDGPEAEPGEEEREELPAPEDQQNPEAPPAPEGPQTPEDPLVPEGPQSPEDVEYELQVMEEAEERTLVP